MPQAEEKAQGFFVAGGNDRYGASLHFLNGRFDCKVSGKDTGGALATFDTIRTEPGGPGEHYHYEQDEWFYVVEGDFVFKIGEVFHRLKGGDSIFGPRRVPHAFVNTSPTGRLLIVYQPAGSMEEFFAEGARQALLTPEIFERLSREHGMEVVGPPLDPASFS